MATRTITTRIALDGEKAFKDQMAQVNGELRNLKSEMTLVDATFKGLSLIHIFSLLAEDVEDAAHPLECLAPVPGDQVKNGGLAAILVPDGKERRPVKAQVHHLAAILKINSPHKITSRGGMPRCV